ncbi:hypothetical protein KAR91_13080 [Candidatus Pacearchaeota archaeon]|nr:hypothetical protein [Candidatus Pacearchaeota archaeon]
MIKPPEIHEGEELCTECEGSGSRYVRGNDPVNWNTSTGIVVCEKCAGKGKTDWLEKVTGPKKLNFSVQQMRAIKARIGKPVNIADSMIVLNHQEECNRLTLSILKSRGP